MVAHIDMEIWYKIIKHVMTLSIGLVLLTACGEEKAPPPEVESKLVKVFTVPERDSSSQRIFPGRVVAGKKVALAFQVSGQLIELPIVDGQKVEQGQLLAKIDPRDFQNDYNSKQARVKKSQRDLARAAKLLKSGTIAQAQYDKFLADYEIAVADAEIAKKALLDTELKAPFAGLIATKLVDNFQNVQAKQEIIYLQDIAHVDIELDLPEKFIIQRKQISKQEAMHGMSVPGFVSFDAMPDKKFKVKLREFKTQADPVTQTYRIKVTMPTPDNINVLPGMTASLYFDNQNGDSGFLIPVTAVMYDSSGKAYVWLVDSNKKAQKKSVTVGMVSGNHILIQQGVKPGDIIISAGGDQVQNDMPVRLMTEN